ncbi:collagen alpha-1(I) chain-like [Gopherus evgoodei]|uniref:collagen alpha-1(I) chain-like n=1 Tax=Gopherus evgoodei TaxID=1825980 RepID=UPI0011D00C1B|nr:collagen alpha-1(I) chain-like [Gopherus evgoodei]
MKARDRTKASETTSCREFCPSLPLQPLQAGAEDTEGRLRPRAGPRGQTPTPAASGSGHLIARPAGENEHPGGNDPAQATETPGALSPPPPGHGLGQTAHRDQLQWGPPSLPAPNTPRKKPEQVRDRGGHGARTRTRTPGFRPQLCGSWGAPGRPGSVPGSAGAGGPQDARVPSPALRELGGPRTPGFRPRLCGSWGAPGRPGSVPGSAGAGGAPDAWVPSPALRELGGPRTPGFRPRLCGSWGAPGRPGSVPGSAGAGGPQDARVPSPALRELGGPQDAWVPSPALREGRGGEGEPTPHRTGRGEDPPAGTAPLTRAPPRGAAAGCSGPLATRRSCREGEREGGDNRIAARRRGPGCSSSRHAPRAALQLPAPPAQAPRRPLGDVVRAVQAPPPAGPTRGAVCGGSLSTPPPRDSPTVRRSIQDPGLPQGMAPSGAPAVPRHPHCPRPHQHRGGIPPWSVNLAPNATVMGVTRCADIGRCRPQHTIITQARALRRVASCPRITGFCPSRTAGLSAHGLCRAV